MARFCPVGIYVGKFLGIKCVKYLLRKQFILIQNIKYFVSKIFFFMELLIQILKLLFRNKNRFHVNKYLIPNKSI